MALNALIGQSGINDIHPVLPSPKDRLSPYVQRHFSTIRNEKSIVLEVLTRNPSDIRRNCEASGIHVLTAYTIDESTCLLINLRGDQLPALLSMEDILMVEYQRNPIEELRQEGLDLSLNEVTLIHHDYPQLTGNSFTLSIKENAFDTTDIDFKGRYLITTLSPERVNVHATNMATIAAGAGNSDPTAEGVARDAGISSTSFDNLLPDPDSYFEAYNIFVQNHSYGTGIENYYGIESAAYDEAVSRIPSLVHIFSSGNDGDKAAPDGIYSGLSEWANITGQFKQSKNTLTVGATDSIANVVSQSSRGPAYDGRIKPEIVAYGHGGTSGAAALVSGLSILLQDEYKKIHANDFPPSSLIKAILVNTAKDIGRPGPDFESGFGSVQGFEAIKAIEENQFEVDLLSKGDAVIIPVSIPEGISKFYATLAWTDPAAAPNAAKALINDLDLTLKNNITGDVWYPWVLNAYPHPDSLFMPAESGVDSINNIEQITLSFPASGEYALIVSGQKVKSDFQEYSLTWHFFESNTFQWVFPTGSDHLKPGSKNILRWKDQHEIKGKIEYKPVDQDTWYLVSDQIEPTVSSIFWTTPAESGLIQLRWTNSDTTFLSDTIVVGNALRPKVGFVCPDSLLMYWEPTDGADSFEILTLGEKHLEHLDFTTDTFYIIRELKDHGYHYAVSAFLADHSGPRSYGFDYRTQGAGCYINGFFLRYIQDGTAFFDATLGSLYNVESVALQKLDGSILNTVFNISPVTDTRLFPEAAELDQGINYFRLVVTLKNGITVNSEDLLVYNLPDNDILVFPNPSLRANGLQILVGSSEPYTLKIIDPLGKEVITLSEPTNPQPIDVSGLAAGLYYAVITHVSGNTAAKGFIVKD